MELKITSNNENKLLNRREISFTVVQDAGTVPRAEIAKELCKKLSLNPDGMAIVRINQGYGVKESSGIAHSYENKQMLEKYESKKVAGKNGAAEKKGEKPAAATEEKKE